MPPLLGTSGEVWAWCGISLRMEGLKLGTLTLSHLVAVCLMSWNMLELHFEPKQSTPMPYDFTMSEVWRTKSKVGPYRILICLCSSIWHNSTQQRDEFLRLRTPLGLSDWSDCLAQGPQGPICPWLLWACNEPTKCFQPMLPPQNQNQPQVDAVRLTSCASTLLMRTKALKVPAASRSQSKHMMIWIWIHIINNIYSSKSFCSFTSSFCRSSSSHAFHVSSKTLLTQACTIPSKRE